MYIEKHTKDKKLNADEMSDFYKDFLDKNWKTHVKYNVEWYKKNFRILFLSLAVHIQSFLNKKLVSIIGTIFRTFITTCFKSVIRKIHI